MIFSQKTIHFPLLFCVLLTAPSLFAQTDSIEVKPKRFTYSGYSDAFIAYDWNQTGFGSKRQAFLYNHNWHGFTLNHFLAQTHYNHKRFRANLGLHLGSYVNENYAQEPDIFKYIYQANVGFSLHKNKLWWLDIGIMESHIGFETALSYKNQTLTRSLCAENSPYFMAGTKLSFAPSEKWEMNLLLLNGWQRVRPVVGSTLPALGIRIAYSPNDKISVNWSTFIGTDEPESTRKMRYFSNLYATYTWSEKFNITAGFDFGLEQQALNSNQHNFWWNLTVIGQYHINSKMSSAFRAEIMQDQYNVIMPKLNNQAFLAYGFSGNFDYTIDNTAIFRIELRNLNSPYDLFPKGENFTPQNWVLVGSFVLKID